MENNIKITLTKSLIGRQKKQIATARSLGLAKPGDAITLPADAVIEGKIRVISHLVKVETV